MITLPYTIQQLSVSSLVMLNGQLTVPGSVFDSNFTTLAQMWTFGTQPAAVNAGQLWVDTNYIVHIFNGSAWLEIVPVVGTQPTSPFTGQLWIDTNNNLNYYNGTAWFQIAPSSYITNTQLTNGSLTPTFGATVVATATASNQAVNLAQMQAAIPAAPTFFTNFTQPGRGMNTAYTNNTGKPMFVAVSANIYGGYTIGLYINGATVSYFTQGSAAEYVVLTVIGIVPPGATYQVNCGYGVNSWTEIY